MYAATWSVAHHFLAIAFPGLTYGHCRCSRLQRDSSAGAGSRASPREVGRLRGTLSKYYVRICDAHTVGSYEPFGVHNPLILAENPAPSLTSPHSHPLRCTSVLITVVQPAIHLDEGGSTTTPQRRHSHSQYYPNAFVHFPLT